MCLFIQNQDFQKHTEAVLNILSLGARHAAEQLTSLNSSIGSNVKAVGRMMSSLADLGQGQERVAHGVEQGLTTVRQLQSQATNLEDKLTLALRNEVHSCLCMAHMNVCIALVNPRWIDILPSSRTS